jgi:hypothetical protein
MPRNPFIVKRSTPLTNGPARRQYVHVIFLPFSAIAISLSEFHSWLGGSPSSEHIPPPSPAHIASPRLACCVTNSKTDNAFRRNRSAQLPPSSCCAPLHCSQRTGTSLFLSLSYPVFSGRSSSMCVLPSFRHSFQCREWGAVFPECYPLKISK